MPLLGSPNCPAVNSLPSSIDVTGNICSYLISSISSNSSRTVRFDLIWASTGLVYSSASVCVSVVSDGFESLDIEQEILY